MASFHSTKITDYRQETANTVSIAFAVDFQKFIFIAGQYISIEVEINGEKHRRAYSICSAPSDNELRIAVKKIDQGVVSVYLNDQIKVGDELMISTPQGNFTHQPKPSNENHYFVFGAGSGITPLLSIIKAIINDEPKSKTTLFYGNRSANSIIFRNELTKLEEDHKNLQVINILTDNSLENPLFCGRMDFGKIMQLISEYGNDSLNKEFYTCGPADMMQAVQTAAEASGYAKNTVHMEYFTAPVENNAIDSLNEEEVLPAFEGESQVEVTLDDEVFEFKVPTKGKSILEFCIQEDVDPPYSCRGGICVSCMAKVEEGQVIMDNNNALSEEEVKEGYILTCQAHPASEKVRITFDD